MNIKRAIAEDRADWRAAKPDHARKALRDYRRKVIPMAEEPCSLVDSWPFLLCGVVVVSLLVWASAWGYI